MHVLGVPNGLIDPFLQPPPCSKPRRYKQPLMGEQNHLNLLEQISNTDIKPVRNTELPSLSHMQLPSLAFRSQGWICTSLQRHEACICSWAKLFFFSFSTCVSIIQRCTVTPCCLSLVGRSFSSLKSICYFGYLAISYEISC